MSLQVHLPLISNNANQGLLNLTASNVGTVSYIDGGKFGKCLSAGTGGQVTNGISYNSNLVSELGDEYSCSIWVKPLGNHVHYNGTFVSSGNWNGKCWSFGVSQNNSQVDVFCSKYNTYIICEVPVNIWTHLACSCKNGTVKLYKNGEYVGERAVGTTLSSDASNFTVGRETYANGYFSFNGNINDLRIYNHALSEQEIKKLAKGLMIHYPLSNSGNGTSNIINNSFTMPLGTANPTTGTWRYAGTSNMGRSRVQLSDGSYAFQNSGIQTANDASCYGIDSYPFEANTDYTISMYARIVDGTEGYAGYAIYSCTINDGTYTKVDKGYHVTPLNDKWKRCWLTFRTNSATKRNIYIGITTGSTSVTTQMRLIKIEKGTCPTSWQPNTSDDEYTAMGYDDTTIYDVSGFKYNGAETGDITNTTDTPCYAVSTSFVNGSYIRSQLPTPTGFNNSYTFSWWGKYINYSNHMMWGYGNGNRLNLYMKDGNFYWNTGNGIANPFNVSAATYGDNNWHYFAVTGDGTTSKLYIDGEFKANAKTYRGITGDVLYFNGWDTSNTYKFNGSLSDFRLYTTPLSAEQIAEIYNTAIQQNSNGVLKDHELVEVIV